MEVSDSLVIGVVRLEVELQKRWFVVASLRNSQLCELRIDYLIEDG